MRTLIILLLSANIALAQTGSILVDQDHTGHKIMNVATPTSAGDAANKSYVDAHSGGGGGSVSLTGTSPIIVTPSPITGTGVVSLDSTSKTNWDTAFSQTRQWDGGSTGLVAATGRTSLGLVIGTNVAPATSGSSILYGNGSGGFSSVTVGTGLTFSTGTLAATGGGGNLSNTGTPLDNQVAVFTDATHVEGNSNLSFDSSTNILSSSIISAVTGFRINGAAANRRILVGNATNFVQSTETYAVPGTSGNVMQSDGTNWTSAQQAFSGLSGNWTLAQGPTTTASKLIGRTDASAGIPQEITLGTNLAMSGTTLNATGGGGGTPGGSNTQVQYNNSSAFGGITNLTSDGTNVTALSLGSTIVEKWSTDLGLTRNGAGVLEVNTGTAGQWGAIKSGVRDAGTATITYGLTVGHQSTGTPTTFFGSGILLNANDATVADQAVGEFAAGWQNAVDASRTSLVRIRAAGSSGLSGQMTFYNSGYLTNDNTTDGGGAYINANSGFRTAGGTPGNGKILQSNSLGYVGSTSAWPTTVSTAGKVVMSDATNFVMSTPTFPTLAGTAGYTIRSDGTNFTSYPQDMLNTSTASVSSSYAADTYLAGSSVVVAVGDFKAKGQYHCIFDMVKTGAGVATPIITLRVGTTGTVASDAAIITFTFGAGTGVVDTGQFEVWANWRTVGSGTSAVMAGTCKGVHNLATTGLFNNAATWMIIGTVSSGFNSSTATTIGLSFNGGSSFSGTNTTVQAQLLQ